MAEWVVELNGDETTLLAWERLFPLSHGLPGVSAWTHSEVTKWVLSAPEINAAPKAQDAYQIAATLLQTMNQIVSTEGVEKTTAGIVYDRADPEYKGMIVGFIMATLPMPTVSVKLTTPVPEDMPVRTTLTLALQKLIAARCNVHYADALRYLNENTAWHNIYKGSGQEQSKILR